MHSPQPFPWGSAPVAVQSRPVSNRTYSAEIPRLSRCRHSSSAATSRIIAYQKRSHARISVPYITPICKLFCPIFRTFFTFFLSHHILYRTPHPSHHIGERHGYTIIYRSTLPVKFAAAFGFAESPKVKKSPTFRQGNSSFVYASGSSSFSAKSANASHTACISS